MPELPEAETIARYLHERLTNAIVTSTRVCRRDILHGDPRPLSRVITGRRVHGVSRRAKRVVMQLDRDVKLVFRLGMTGGLVVVREGERVQKHTHLRIRFGQIGSELRFRDPRRFGGVWCLVGDRCYPGPGLGPVGPEPLTLKPRSFIELLASRKRPIKSLLLDQGMIAGLGNIYCDESLFVAGIHPLTRCDRLDDPDARRLLRAIKSVLGRAIKAGGSTLSDYRQADGQPGMFQLQHKVYGQTGKPCRRCFAIIERTIVAGRTTHYCPSCQTQRLS